MIDLIEEFAQLEVLCHGQFEPILQGENFSAKSFTWWKLFLLASVNQTISFGNIIYTSLFSEDVFLYWDSLPPPDTSFLVLFPQNIQSTWLIEKKEDFLEISF